MDGRRGTDGKEETNRREKVVEDKTTYLVIFIFRVIIFSVKS